ncbi:hypothetical protein K505DRAFT_249299 [Melanomma pulvis-pyrius CBS 109.77]|uniref:Methyltransferase CmcJ n=1 Tax=Melanomma pulvis-pyrius CBS 109.77 TaxID=1314802 RepID=A0A6A6X551_9PLEO|nr:hypothetical protein K505DRAFT_249299 [Melanomma pulvis-pyrius CBS 109.77]
MTDNRPLSALSAASGATTNFFQYLAWQDIYIRERPYQVLLNVPDRAREKRRHNLVFHDGPEEIVHDVRDRASDFTLDNNGFTYIKQRSSLSIKDFDNREMITKTFLQEVEQVLKANLSGVDQVYIYDWRRRRRGSHPLHGKQIDFADPLSPLGPATQVHLDQSPASVVQRVFNYLPEQADHLVQGRVRLMNLWRPIGGPVENWPLAVCDGSTLPETSLVECERIRREYVGNTMYLLQTAGIKWYYHSQQSEDDLLIFKTFDSSRDVAANCKYTQGLTSEEMLTIVDCSHGSFQPKDVPSDTKIRQSIEVRALVFTYPENC